MATLVTSETRDVDDQAQALTGFRQFYEQLGRGRFHGRVWQLMLSQGFMLRESANRSLRQYFSPPAGHVTLAVPLAVEPGSVFAGRPLARESLVVLDADQEYDLLSAGEMDIIALSVHRTLLDTLAPQKAEWMQRALAQCNLTLTPEAAGAIRHMLLAVSAQAERELLPAEDRPLGSAQSEAQSEAQHAAQEVEVLAATLTQTVLLAMGSDASTELAQAIPRRADSRRKVVQRAVDYMRERLHGDIGIPDICSAACASRRTLQYCFEEFLHTTPQAYLRALRLNEARRTLKGRGAAPLTAITSLASDLGFANASHFTRHYKLMFDELPSETLKAYGINPAGPCL